LSSFSSWSRSRSISRSFSQATRSFSTSSASTNGFRSSEVTLHEEDEEEGERFETPNQELPIIVERKRVIERTLINTIEEEEEEEVSPGR